MFTSKLGIQSWCFHTYKETEKVIEALGKCGVDKIELCGVHLDVHSPAGTLQQYRDNGITVTSFGVHYFSTDEAEARKVFEFACLAGFPAISADLDLNALDMVEKLCAEYCLYPTVCDASLGHNFHLGAGYDTWADDVSPEAWADELEEHYTYVYLYSISEEFVGKYGALFAEPSSIAAGGLYRVGGSGGGLLVRIN